MGIAKYTMRMMLVGFTLAGGMYAARPAHADDTTPAPATAPESGGSGTIDTANPRAEAAAQRPMIALLDRIQKAVNALNLTDEQQKQMDTVFSDARDQLQSLQADLKSMDPDARRQKLRSFVTDLRDQILDILTDDQKAQLKEKMSSIMAQNGGGGQKLAALKSALDSMDLTDDQKKQIDQLLRDTRQKAKDLAAQAADGDVKDQLQELRQSALGKLRDILTPDQLQELRDKMQDQETHPANVPDNANDPNANETGNPPHMANPLENPVPTSQPAGN
jgi:Spy/CpxP family protein refolding chaperone